MSFLPYLQFSPFVCATPTVFLGKKNKSTRKSSFVDSISPYIVCGYNSWVVLWLDKLNWSTYTIYFGITVRLCLVGNILNVVFEILFVLGRSSLSVQCRIHSRAICVWQYDYPWTPELSGRCRRRQFTLESISSFFNWIGSDKSAI